jgi:hypothetical protein
MRASPPLSEGDGGIEGLHGRDQFLLTSAWASMRSVAIGNVGSLGR